MPDGIPERHELPILPRVQQKKNSNKYKKQLNKIEDEVGMAGPKNTQTRFVGLIMSTIHPYVCFLSSYMGHRNKLTVN
jgi:hypothetical protein